VPPRFEPEEVHVLTDLAQLKVLADPLRVRILEAFCRDEATTKQVAEALGEKPTRLYHHVEALERVGLLHPTRTRRNRGTLEKYFRAVARSFRADSGLFSVAGSDSPQTPLPEVVDVLLARTRDELAALVAAEGAAGLETSGVLGFCEIHASEARLAELRDRLEALLAGRDPEAESDEAESGDTPGNAPARRYRLTVAFYPLDRTDSAS
jgi:DNA-binding transcriptional ArsR family regulator